MTDVTVTTGTAGSGGGGGPAGGGRSESIPINPDSGGAGPTPVGSQAPQKQGFDQNAKPPSGRPESRREAIQRAFDRAVNPPAKPEKRASEPAKPAPKAAEAKPGHNKPPEETEKLDLKKRPSDQPRGERGQFAPRQPVAEQAAPGAQGHPSPSGRPDAATQQQVKQLPANAPFRDPPQRMSEQARASWADTPETVRGDVHRMHQEFAQAHQRYRADFEAMNDIRHFQQMAAQHGTTLRTALTNYVGMEQKLRSDVIAGLDQIIYNLNLKADNGNRVTLRDIAYHVLKSTPEQLQQVSQGNRQHGQEQQIGQLHQAVAGLQHTIHQMHTAAQFKDTRSAVDAFAETHPRLDELADLIEQEIKLGFDIEQAYRRAEMLRPATQAAQTRAQSGQTRDDSDRSISGAPAAGGGNSPSTARRKSSEKAVGRREAIGNAIRRANGSL